MPTRDGYPTGTGEAAGIIAGFDWAATPLGPLEGWSSSLTHALALILPSPVAIAILWGSDGTILYNDAYAALLGDRHPALFGTGVQQGLPDVAAFHDRVVRGGNAGGPLQYRGGGRPGQGPLKHDCSPLLDDDGRPAGVMAVVVDPAGAAVEALDDRYSALKRMFEQSPAIMAITSGPDHRFRIVNRGSQTIAGREVLGRNMIEAFPEIVAQGYVRLLDDVFASGEPYTGRCLPVDLNRPDGTVERIFADLVFQPIKADDGTTTDILIQGRDVTGQHVTEQEIRAGQRRLKVLNPGAALAAEMDVDRIAQIVTDACTELADAEFGMFFYRVTDDGGAPAMRSAVSGVSRERLAAQPLPRHGGLFEPAFTSTAVVHSDDVQRDPRYIVGAPAGPPAAELPVRSYLAVPVTSRSGEPIGELFFGHREASQFVDEHRALVTGIAGQAAIAIDAARLYQAAEREVAERRRAEEALQALNNTLEQRVVDEIHARSRVEEQLRQVQKMEAVGQLTGGIAHDFNNMLAVIMGGLNLLQRKLARGENDVERFIAAAIDGAERAATLTQRLLAFSRQQSLSPETLVVNKLVASMSELLARTLGEHVKVETVLAAGLWPVRADPQQLENAILNLAVNARDAMPCGGKLTIETLNAFVDDTYARQYAIETGQYVLVAVADTGFGMTPEVMARAFDPFFTTKGTGKGTGLGLSQVYGFVRQTGGHVRIYSELGVGTSVKIYLPRYYGETEATGPASLAGSIHRGLRDELILVVEDDERVRALAVEALKEIGYGVIEAANAAQALRLIEDVPQVTLLFTDVVMPDMSGKQLADRVRESRPQLKVLYTTGYTRNAIVHNGMLDPGTNLLTKPFTIEELAAKIRGVLDGGN